MTELFIIYVYGRKPSKIYMDLDIECGPIWHDDRELAIGMEKTVAGLWFKILKVEEPTLNIGIERV